jgi:hypothetical protein
MITDKGKAIFAKYMIGQTPAYASYIALGCGPKPLSAQDQFTDEQKAEFSTKTSLDFEMFRVPITSRGYLVEDGVSKIVFSAELPTEERYEISEIGVYSAGSNPDAGLSDSRTLIKFSDAEGWVAHDLAVSALGTSPLTGETFLSNANNPVLRQTERVARYETTRFLNSVIGIRGDFSNLSLSSGSIIDTITNSRPHIHLTGTKFDLSRQGPADELALAFSVADGLVGPESGETIDKILVRVEFLGTESSASNTPHARFDVILQNDEINSFDNNRYFVVSKQLSELYLSSNFSWADATTIRVFATVINDSGNASDRYYVNLDGMRLENKTLDNPLYGLVGYTVIKNTDGTPIVKSPNTKNFVEFRFAMDVI